MQGLLGKKIGMTRVFDAERGQVPVTVIECGPCTVLQVKNKKTDGYDAVQVGFWESTEKHLSKSELSRFSTLKITPKRYRVEFSLDAGEERKAGDVVTVALFEEVKLVDVTGVTKGKGFQGVVRRYRVAGGPKTHGSHSKRRIGAVGQRETPGSIHKNKKMPGHMGHVRVTQKNLRVVQVLPEENAILVLGAVPGPAGSIVMVRKVN